MPQFTDYDTITDTVLRLSYDTTFNLAVKLAKKDKDGKRNHCHHEFKYPSRYVGNNGYLYSIKRNFDYYYTIEKYNSDTKTKTYIQIRLQHMIMLQNILANIVNILYDEKRWKLSNKRLVFTGAVEKFLLSGLPMEQWISFEPIVMTNYNEQFGKGIRITLGDESIYTDVVIDDFMGFVYFINTGNMFEQAQTLMNYINWHDYGTNLVSFNNEDDQIIEDTESLGVINATNRTIPKKPKSFFDKKSTLDKIDDLG